MPVRKPLRVARGPLQAKIQDGDGARDAGYFFENPGAITTQRKGRNDNQERQKHDDHHNDGCNVQHAVAKVMHLAMQKSVIFNICRYTHATSPYRSDYRKSFEQTS